MSLRKLGRAALAAFLFSAIPFASVYAVTAAQTQAQTAAEAAQAQRLAALKTKGAAEIERRLATLAAAEAKLKASTRLSEANRQALTGQLAGEVASLTTLKQKLAADTTLVSARTNVAAIVTDFRVYALLLPKIRLVATLDRFETTQSKLAVIVTKLEQNVASAKAAGKDVTSAEASLAKIKASVDASKTKTLPLSTKVLALTPTDYNADHAVLLEYRTTLVSARDDIRAAAAEAKKLNAALSQL